jgi:hypothetical protein
MAWSDWLQGLTWIAAPALHLLRRARREQGRARLRRWAISDPSSSPYPRQNCKVLSIFANLFPSTCFLQLIYSRCTSESVHANLVFACTLLVGPEHEHALIQVRSWISPVLLCSRSACYYSQNANGRGTASCGCYTSTSTRKEGCSAHDSGVATTSVPSRHRYCWRGRHCPTAWPWTPRASLSSTGRGNLPLSVPDGFVLSDLVAADFSNLFALCMIWQKSINRLGWAFSTNILWLEESICGCTLCHTREQLSILPEFTHVGVSLLYCVGQFVWS